MKIVQLLPELNEGGVEVETIELNRELVYLGHESIVISNGGKVAKQIGKDGGQHITFDVASKNIFTLFWRVYRLRKLLKALKPDIIHARSRVPAWLSFLANQTLHIPFVTTVHGFNSVSPYSRIMTAGDEVICVSNAIKEYIRKHYQTVEEKITVIPGGIDLMKFDPDNIDRQFMETFKKHYELENQFVISVVGRITQLKDIETFIHAVALVKENRPDIKALIVGGVHKDKENYFESLKKVVKELGVENEVVFTGSQSNVAEIYALSSVVVSASKKPESFGRSVAEAIAMNTPVVATNHGGVKDIIIEGENGFFAEIGHADSLAEKIVKAKDLTFDGNGYIKKNFSLPKIVAKTLEVYEKAIEKNKIKV